MLPLLLLLAADKLPPDLALVPRDALWFASARPADLAAMPALKDAFAHRGMKRALRPLGEWKTGLEGLERVTAFSRRVFAPSRFDFGEDYRLWPRMKIYRTAKPYDKDALAAAMKATVEAKAHGKTFRVEDVPPGRDRLCVWMADERTFVVCYSPREMALYLAALAKGGEEHPLAKELEAAAGKAPATFAARPSAAIIDAEAMNRVRAVWRREGIERYGIFRKPDAKEPERPPAKEPSLEEEKDPEMAPKPLSEALALASPLTRPFWRARLLTGAFGIDAKTGEATLKMRATYADEDAAGDGETLAAFALSLPREGGKAKKLPAGIADLLGKLEGTARRDGSEVVLEAKAKPGAAAVPHLLYWGTWLSFGDLEQRGKDDD
ncbi:MAG: hypothetical protein K2W96_25940 [Gemmataceae bacterium]|nr:hypothetical protein [Gemmataceae bacterium]